MTTRDMTEAAFPAFVFARLHDIELEAGFTLAGNLIVDLPKAAKLTTADDALITAIIQNLTDAAASGQMPYNAICYGWCGGCRPPNAVDVKDHAAMAAWARTRTMIAVRVDPRDDGMLRIDSDLVGLPTGRA